MGWWTLYSITIIGKLQQKHNYVNNETTNSDYDRHGRCGKELGWGAGIGVGRGARWTYGVAFEVVCV